jgi:hypothetical protein
MRGICLSEAAPLDKFCQRLKDVPDVTTGADFFVRLPRDCVPQPFHGVVGSCAVQE